jgi:hypothetical protein
MARHIHTAVRGFRKVNLRGGAPAYSGVNATGSRTIALASLAFG